MTGKEIIIDGVDVAGCEDFKPKDRFTCHPYICNCHQNPDCHYKQLRRKEQECKELRKKVEDYKHDRFCQGGCAVYQYDKIHKLKQALEKIVGILQQDYVELSDISKVIKDMKGDSATCNM